MRKIIWAFGLLTLSCTAQFHRNMKGSGTVTKETHQTKDYDVLDVAGPFTVTLTEGKEGNISVKADDNLHELIVVEVRGDALYIGFERGVNLKKYKELHVTVPVRDLEEVSLAGSGTIKNEFVLKSDDFKVNLTGSGDIELRLEAEELLAEVVGSGDVIIEGKAETANYEVTGSGDIKARSLDAMRVYAEVIGSGDISLAVKDELKAKVSGSGDIVYVGEPSNEKLNVAGSGSIKKK